MHNESVFQTKAGKTKPPSEEENVVKPNDSEHEQDKVGFYRVFGILFVRPAVLANTNNNKINNIIVEIVRIQIHKLK